MQICPYCHTGKMHERKIVFVQIHHEGAIVVDRLPAIVCDTCGQKSYDPYALENLQRLLWANNNEDKRLSSALNK